MQGDNRGPPGRNRRRRAGVEFVEVLNGIIQEKVLVLVSMPFIISFVHVTWALQEWKQRSFYRAKATTKLEEISRKWITKKSWLNVRMKDGGLIVFQ